VKLPASAAAWKTLSLSQSMIVSGARAGATSLAASRGSAASPARREAFGLEAQPCSLAGGCHRWR